MNDPMVIVEVLSPTTQRNDRGDKRLAYRQLPSLREYVLVSQDRVRVELFAEEASSVILERAEDRLVIASLDFSISLAEVYA